MSSGELLFGEEPEPDFGHVPPEMVALLRRSVRSGLLRHGHSAAAHDAAVFIAAVEPHIWDQVLRYSLAALVRAGARLPT